MLQPPGSAGDYVQTLGQMGCLPDHRHLDLACGTHMQLHTEAPR